MVLQAHVQPATCNAAVSESVTRPVLMTLPAQLPVALHVAWLRAHLLLQHLQAAPLRCQLAALLRHLGVGGGSFLNGVGAPLLTVLGAACVAVSAGAIRR